MTNLVFIHGRDQQGKDPEQLKQLWVDTLKGGFAKSGLDFPPDVKVIMPFYGDLLASLQAQAVAEAAAKMTEKGNADETDEDKLNFYYDYLSEVMKEKGITWQELQALNDSEKLELIEKGWRNWSTVRLMMRALDHTPAGKIIIEKSELNDVHQYLTNYSVRTQVNAAVLPVLAEGPCVVVAHSLGTVIGYNLLYANPKLNIDSFFTLGSPLGIKAIRDRLEKPLRMPACIKHKWHNGRDKGDYVALRPLTKDNFNITPAITNYDLIRNMTPEKHGIEGYLNDPHFAALIHQRLSI